MKLTNRLAALVESAQARIPEDSWAIMRRAVDDLRADGILDRVRKPGEPMPEFALPDPNSATVHSGDLLGRHRALVVSFFRGRW